MRLQLRYTTIAAGLVLAAAWAPATAQTGRVLSRSPDGLFTVTADGPSCGPRVSVTVAGKDKSFFEGSAPRIEKLIAGLRPALSYSCPAMKRLLIRGKVGQQPVLSAMSDATSGWNTIILGASQFDALENAPAPAAGNAPRTLFARAGTFVPAGQIVTEAKTRPYLCSNGGAGTCEGTTEFRNMGPAGGLVLARYPANAQGTIAEITSRTRIDGGMFCSDPAQATIQIVDPKLTPDAKADFATLISERLRQRSLLCNGFSRTGPGSYRSVTFDEAGRQVGKPGAVTMLTSQPRLVVAK